MKRKSRAAPILLAIALSFSLTSIQAQWTPLEDDQLHDPSNPAIESLQQPEAALSVLSPDTAGNRVNWVDALRSGEIQPRTNIYPETKVNILDLDILFKQTSDMQFVLFPHDVHTEWLDCANCHEQIFKQKAGATKFGMAEILEGKYCGQCHGAVAFPLTECKRCHNVPRQ